MRPIVDGQNVLFLGRDNFVSWELIGSEVYAPITNHYDVEEIPPLYRATDLNAKFDWDNVPPFVMNEFKWVVTTSAAMQSEAPSGFEPRLRTHDFILWHRDHPVGQRRTLFEPINPGAPLDCSDPGRGRSSRKVDGTATVFTVQPVVGRVWRPSPELTQSKPAQQRLYLTPGRWDISIQYASTQPLHVTAAGGPTRRALRCDPPDQPAFPRAVAVLPGRDARGEEAGRGRSSTSASMTRRWSAGCCGTESKAYLTGLAATRADPPREVVPLHQACGRYVDWYEVAPGTPASALQGVPAPHPQPIENDEPTTIAACHASGHQPGDPRCLPARVDGDRHRQAQLSGAVARV